MHGLTEIIHLCLAALLANGHVLLEGNPGTGKTMLVRTLGETLDLPWGRIQFTPDLMPADITGSHMWVPDKNNPTVRNWELRRGPIFKSLLLADEINRATPKTQAAMLEAMAEKQVSVGGETHHLPSPFMVLATQNPIDQEGTYQLPEAQADRFMFKLMMPVVGPEDLQKIIAKDAGPLLPRSASSVPGQVSRAIRLPHDDYQRLIRAHRVLPIVEQHASNLFYASQRMLDRVRGVADPDRLNELIKLVRFGLGPRAVTALLLGAKAWSAMDLVASNPKRQITARNNPQRCADARDLAHVALPVLRHRLLPIYDWDERFWRLTGRRPPFPVDDPPPDLWNQFLCALVEASAPKKEDAGKQYVNELNDELKFCAA